MAKPLTSQITFKTDSYYSLLDIIYPVGTLYFSYSSTSPASLFGGTWSQLFDRFIRVANNVSTGGSNTHTHTMNGTENSGSHSHGLKSGYGRFMGASDIIEYQWKNAGETWTSNYGLTNLSGVGWARNQSTGMVLAGSTDSAGSHSHNVKASNSASNMPIYQNVYCWHRTA